ncbi:glycerol-3-phosphate ABC transporter ATP-binding protein [Rhizobium rhizosphaerae]|uniref:Glycerol-3-phosphate ABC transporter ATP-binding protein n=1 Tax=Xaviernesmea rhizosphaerae TaxID=1672749 RepID=A0ABX3PG09_9HYPH|nr:ABC transporter ATP-binding protein [Xaviernesmea rhizosphaerae]OQP87474.1 glycerol-3-phosphate ABC transporter ATP-binding protein [Xaviernesmea rhizosphaerae]
MHGKDIKITGIRKDFGATNVLKSIDLHVRKGEFLTLLGPSGCGKSTLLRLIAGFDVPTSGSIEIGGRDVTRLAPKEREIAMVFQSYALYPHMTARRNMSVPLEMQRLSFAQRLPGAALVSGKIRQIRKEIAVDVERVCEQLGLASLLDRKPAQLSGGQRQRVAVGRALVREPSVFLMDEPLSNLDAKLRNQLREELADLQRRTGITFVFVTHDQKEAMALSDRIALMQDGQVVQCGAPDEIYRVPNHVSVARFVGSVAINEIPVAIRNEDLFAGPFALGLRAAGAPDGAYMLAIRAEALEPVPQSSDAVCLQLPVAHVEYSGSEVFVRCSGRDIGTEWIRFQVPVEQFAQLRAGGHLGDTVSLRLRAHGAHVFTLAGERMPAVLVNRYETNGLRHVLSV